MSSKINGKMNELQQGVRGGLRGILAAVMLSVSALASAAIPLNDQELDKNFVTGELANDPTGAVFGQIVTLSDKKPSPLALSPVDDLSSLVAILDSQQTRLMMSMDNPYMDASSFGEVAMHDFGSEFYSYRWAKNFDDIFTPSRVQYFYFNSISGYMEIDNNIKGTVEVEAIARSGNRERPLFQSTYRFN